jgi:hypothetical protein
LSALGALAECDHQTLKVTPAMAAGVTDKLWEIGDIVAMVEAWEAEQAKTGTVYKIGKDDIGDGYHVRLLPRYEEPTTVFGFATMADAEVYIERQRASHRPGQKRKESN